MRFTKHIAAETRRLGNIAPGSVFLDVGSAQCPDIEDINDDMHGNGKIVLVDPAEAGLVVAQRIALEKSLGVSLSTHTARGQDIPLDDNSVDSSRVIRVLQHVEDDPETIVSEMVRVTKPNGTIVLVEPDWESMRLHCDAIDYPDDFLMQARPGRFPTQDKMGRQVGALLERFGAQDVTEQRVTLTMTSLDRADLSLGLSREIPRLVEDGTLNDEEAASLSQILQDEFKAGRAHVTFDYYIASGTAPEPGMA